MQLTKAHSQTQLIEAAITDSKLRDATHRSSTHRGNASNHRLLETKEKKL
jgi:hypothetical protein